MLTVQVIGNLGNDPEMRYNANGAPFLRFSVASNYWTRTQDGERQDKVEWVRVTVTGQRAESLGQYLRKGSKVYVAGRLEARPWRGDNDNVLHAGLQVLANEVQFMSSKDDDEVRQDREQQPARQQQPRQQSLEEDDDLEDLPF